MSDSYEHETLSEGSQDEISDQRATSRPQSRKGKESSPRPPRPSAPIGTTHPTQTGSRRKPLTNRQAASQLTLLLDALVIVLTSILTGVSYHLIALGEYGDIGDFSGIGLLVAIMFCAAIAFSTPQDPIDTSSRQGRARKALLGWINALLMFILAAFALKFGQNISRGATLSFFVAGLLTTTASRVYTPILLARYQKSAAYLQRNIILVAPAGDPHLARFATEIAFGECQEPMTITFDGYCTDREWPEVQRDIIQQVLDAARRLGPGEILISIAQIGQERAKGIMQGLSQVPRSVMIIPDRFTSGLLRHRANMIGSHVVVEIQREPMGIVARATKRAMDIVLGSVAIILCAPIMLVIAAAVKLDSPGPVLFQQRRTGKGGQIFRILKFRSMSVLDDGPIIVQAWKDDPRTTRVGRWLRKTSLDELPQLFNVLRGEMSLVGPRPHACAHDERYRKSIETYDIRQHIKPGITGWAQIHGLRGQTSSTALMQRRVEYDLWYARNCTLLLDLQILLRTPFGLFRLHNAY